MICPSHRNHLGACCVSLGKFQCALDRLGSRIDKIDAFERCGQQRSNLGCVLHLRTLQQLAIDHNVHISLRLAFDGLDYGRVRVAYIADRNTGNQIVVGFTLRRVEKDTFGTLDSRHHRRRRCLADVRQKSTAQNLVGMHTILNFRKLTLSLQRRSTPTAKCKNSKISANVSSERGKRVCVCQILRRNVCLLPAERRV